jgi:hypothetical protein
MSALARLALPGFGAVIVMALCVYVVGYQRHFVRIAEMTEGTSEHKATRSRLGMGLDGWVLRTPFQKGCFRFVCKRCCVANLIAWYWQGSAGSDWFSRPRLC